MESVVERARAFAVSAHGAQRYGVHQYVKHLDDVAGICKPYGETCVVVAYLHDVLEDTPVRARDLEHRFGGYVSLLVEHITDPIGENRAERKATLYDRLTCGGLYYNDALIVKAADRLANVLACVGTHLEMLEMYRREHLEFKRACYRKGLCDGIWIRLMAAIGSYTI